MSTSDKTLPELQAEEKRLIDELREIERRNGPDLDTWPDGQMVRHDNTSRAIDRVRDLMLAIRTERAQQVERGMAAMQNPANREVVGGRVERSDSGAPVSRSRDPWSGLDRAGSINALDSDTGLRTRAADAVAQLEVSDLARESLTTMLDDDKTAHSARFVLALGNPAYRGAFDNWLRSPETAAMDSTPDQLAAWRDVAAHRSALTTSNGSALMPLALDPTVILTNNGSASSVRQYAKHAVTATNQHRSVTSAGITAEIKAEGSEAADASPSLSPADVTIYQGFASITASYEILDDTDLAQQLGVMIVDARTLQEDDLFITGSGSGAPYGVITRLAATTASRVNPTTGGSFTTASVADVYKVRDAVPARHRRSRGVVWLSNIGIQSIIGQMSPAANGSSFWHDLTEGVPARLLGIPMLEATSMVATSTTGSSVLAAVDLRDYLVVDRLGTEIAVHNVQGDNERSTGQREFVARWRFGGDLLNTNAGRVLRL